MQVFKAARLTAPDFVWRTQPSEDDVTQLQAFACVTEEDIKQLQQERDEYIRLVLETCVEAREDSLEWFRAHAARLPAWTKMAKRVLTMQSLSAAAERVFSRFNHNFDETQTSLLEDYIEAAMMCQCNPRP